MGPDILMPWRGPSVGTLLLAVCLPAAAAGPAADDPVEGLRQALRADREAGANPDALAFRRDNLAKHAAAVRGVAGLGRALTLREWRNESLHPKVAALDEEAWEKLAARFDEAVRKVLRQGDPADQLAAADLIAGLAETGRANGAMAGPLYPHLGSLAGPLIALNRQGQVTDVRAAALRALGQIQPDPWQAAAALDRALRADDVALRRAAAGALVSMVAVSSREAKRGRAGGGAPGQPAAPEGLATALQVVPVASRALADPDGNVRLQGAEALRHATALLHELVVLPVALEFPPTSRLLTAQERQQMEDYRAEVEREWEGLAPLARELARQVPALGKAVADADLRVGLAASGTVEALAEARQRLRQRAATVPPLPWKGAGEWHPEDPLGQALKDAVPVLAKRLSADEVRARLASLYALESLGPEAARAAGEVVRALRDRDAFVRWGAARALGEMALKGEAAGKAVAGLAPLLKDDNAAARLGAAAALQRYGAAARGAVAELSAAVKEGDDELRLRAIAALAAVGPEAGKDAVAALVKALQAGEPEVRAASAGALGRVAPADKAAREALRKALDDPDAEVRGAASAALLRREGDK
jgi:HEAT repeat protein